MFLLTTTVLSILCQITFFPAIMCTVFPWILRETTFSCFKFFSISNIPVSIVEPCTLSKPVPKLMYTPYLFTPWIL